VTAWNLQESDPCTQELELTPDHVAEGTTMNLRFVKFQNVTSLSVPLPRLPRAWSCPCPALMLLLQPLTPGARQIFCGANFGNEDQTVIHRLVLFGQPGNLTDMSRWSEVADYLSLRRMRSLRLLCLRLSVCTVGSAPLLTHNKKIWVHTLQVAKKG
jgi:hypothetical protein